MIIKNKRGVVAPLFIVLGFLGVLFIIYLILFLPIPAFTSLRTQVNYFLILAFWVLLQVGIILGYFEIGKYGLKGINLLRHKVMNWSLGIRDYIIVHT